MFSFRSEDAYSFSDDENSFFETLDFNYDGTIDGLELLFAISEQYNSISDEEKLVKLDKILQPFDANRDNSISFSEFMNASPELRKTLPSIFQHHD